MTQALSCAETVKETVKRHWPHSNVSDLDPLFVSYCKTAVLAALDEDDIREFCEALSDFNDAAFDRGVSAQGLTL